MKEVCIVMSEGRVVGAYSNRDLAERAIEKARAFAPSITPEIVELQLDDGRRVRNNDGNPRKARKDKSEGTAVA